MSTKNVAVSKITNCIEAESFIRNLCIEINGVHDSQWCKDYFIKTFPNLTECEMGKILLGLQKGNRFNYYYVPTPF